MSWRPGYFVRPGHLRLDSPSVKLTAGSLSSRRVLVLALVYRLWNPVFSFGRHIAQELCCMQVPYEYDANWSSAGSTRTQGGGGRHVVTGQRVGIPAPQPEPTMTNGISRCLLPLFPRLVRHSVRFLNVECHPIWVIGSKFTLRIWFPSWQCREVRTVGYSEHYRRRFLRHEVSHITITGI